jgi:HD-GYP domain-containing protein (c-di-GMP phosphodiesterase class II)
VLVWVCGAIAIFAAIRALQQNAFPGVDRAIYFALLLVVAIITEMKPVSYAFGPVNKNESLTITLILFTLYTIGWAPAVLLAAASVVVADVVANKPYYKVLFNTSMYAIGALAAYAGYTLALAPLASYADLPPVLQQILARFAGGGVYYLVNVTLLMIVISHVQRVPVGEMIVWNLRDSAIVNFALVSIAIGMSLLWSIHAAAPLVLIPPIFMAKLGYQGYTRLRSETHSVLATLADLLDLRDHNTGQHSRRVADICYGVARTMGVPEAQALAIKAVARVHDVGKIVVRDAVLLKTGPLTAEERAHVQTHLEVGGQILTHLSLYKPHLPILLQHHERVDGRGYPEGLCGEAIVLGARILAVCDAYDTMISDRPYRAAISKETAMLELYHNANSQFDPNVISALETWLTAAHELRSNWREFASQAIVEAGTPVLRGVDDVVHAGEGAILESPQSVLRPRPPKTVQ